ncbi:MAG TPA: glycosyltransferase [Stellaceae bacterium]|nr:glycosyltransferase [Stellaceae bacterium]
MRLLILSYIYAPDRSPRAYRWTALAERWAAQGREVEVVAAWKAGDARCEAQGGVVIHRVGGAIVERLRGMLHQASHRAQSDIEHPTHTRVNRLRRAAKAAYALTLKQLFWPDYAFHWYGPALRKARRLLRQRGFDAIVTVSHPFTPHLVGLVLKRAHPELRWVADIGDPFSLLREIPLNNERLYGRLNRRVEAAVLHGSDAVAVTVESCRVAYAEAFPESVDKIAVVPPLLSLPAEGPAADFAFADRGIHLVCIGTFYRALRDPEYLLVLFAALRRRRPDLHLHIFGALNDCAPSIARHRAALGGSLHLHGMVSRDSIAAAMRSADILVNIGNRTPHQLPSKLVEYVAAARPILNLAAGPADTSVAFLAEHPAALTVDAAGEPGEATIAAVLAFVEAPPRIDPASARRIVEPYGIERIGAAYDRLIAPAKDDVSGPAPSGAAKPIRLLVNAIHARAGGGLTYLRQLLPRLAREGGFDIHVVPHPSQAQAFAGPGIHVHPIGAPRGWLPLLLWEQIALPLRARRIGYDVVLSPANFGPLALGRQVIVLQNALGVGAFERRWSKKLYWWALRLMTRLSLRRACRAIAVSRYVAEETGSVRPPTVIHHGVDETFTPKPSVAPHSFLLAVGDLYLQKNLHRLVEALAIIRRGRPTLGLRIAGAAIDGEYAMSLRKQAAALGLADAVTFLGRCPQDALIELYRSCAAFVFPSLEESFGMPLVEAMACGAPIVASRRAAMPEIVGGAALLVDPEDTPALAAAIERVIGDAALRQRLCALALERARHFSWQDCAARTAAVLREAAGRKAGQCAA